MTDTAPRLSRRRGPEREEACTFVGCEEPRWSGSTTGCCLFHAVENGHDAETAGSVWSFARQRVAARRLDFRGCRFPDDPTGQGFHAVVFPGPVTFEDAVFRGTVNFQDADLRGPQGQGEAVFRSARFEGWAQFEGARFARADFIRADFAGHAHFARAAFEGAAQFDYARFARADFAEAVFDDLTGWSGASFERSALFQRATFRSVSFEQVRFQGRASFLDARFHEAANFQGVHFELAELEGVAFEGPVDFSGARAARSFSIDLPSGGLGQGPKRPFAARGWGQTAFRLAKQSAQDRGDYRLAGEFHYAEQCAGESARRANVELRPWRRGFRSAANIVAFARSVGELLFARVLFGYGERPGRVFLTGLGVIVTWSLLYLSTGALAGAVGSAGGRLGWLDCLHFSTVTFTTVGYGDIAPLGIARLLAGSEAILGTALMALFIVSLARKYER